MKKLLEKIRKFVKDKTKHKQGEVVEIFKGTPAHMDGDVAVILDRDPHNDNYIVVSTRWLEKFDCDPDNLLQRQGKWVESKHFRKLHFTKPNKIYLTIGIILAILSVFFNLYNLGLHKLVGFS